VKTRSHHNWTHDFQEAASETERRSLEQHTAAQTRHSAKWAANFLLSVMKSHAVGQ